MAHRNNFLDLGCVRGCRTARRHKCVSDRVRDARSLCGANKCCHLENTTLVLFSRNDVIVQS